MAVVPTKASGKMVKKDDRGDHNVCALEVSAQELLSLSKNIEHVPHIYHFVVSFTLLWVVPSASLLLVIFLGNQLAVLVGSRAVSCLCRSLPLARREGIRWRVARGQAARPRW